MKKMQLWSPLNDLWDLQGEVNQLFSSFSRGGGRGASEGGMIWSPAVDICEDKEAVKLTVELPGLKKEEVRINVEEGMLTVRGERRFQDEQKRDQYYRIERNYGAFSRSFTLPSTVNSEQIKASMNHGVLEILIPKKEEAKPKEIAIEVR